MKDYTAAIPTPDELKGFNREQAKTALDQLKYNKDYLRDATLPPDMQNWGKLKATGTVRNRLCEIAFAPDTPAEAAAKEKQWQPHSEDEITEAKHKILCLKGDRGFREKLNSGDKATAEYWRDLHVTAHGTKPVI